MSVSEKQCFLSLFSKIPAVASGIGLKGKIKTMKKRKEGKLPYGFFFTETLF